MSYLIQIMLFMQNLASADPEIEASLQIIAKLQQENTELQIQKKLLDKESEYVQEELDNTKNLVDDYIEPTPNFSAQDFLVSQNLKIAIENLDFTKMLECDIIKLEKDYGDEYKLYKDMIGEQLKLQEEMKQRHIVRKYREAEKKLNETRQAAEDMEEFWNSQLRVLQKAKSEAESRRNELLVAAITRSKILREKYLELKQLKSVKEKFTKLKQEDEIVMENAPAKVCTKVFQALNFYDFGLKLPTKHTQVLQGTVDESSKPLSIMSLITKDINSIQYILKNMDGLSGIGRRSILVQDNGVEERNDHRVKKSVHFKEPLSVSKTLDVELSKDTLSESSSIDESYYCSSKTGAMAIEENDPMVVEETDEDDNTDDNNLSQNVSTIATTTSKSNQNSDKVAENVIMNKDGPVEILDCLTLKATTATTNNNNSTSDAMHFKVPEPLSKPPTQAHSSTRKRSLDDFDKYLYENSIYFNSCDDKASNDETTQNPLPRPSQNLTHGAAVADFTDDNVFTFDLSDDNADGHNNNNNSNFL